MAKSDFVRQIRARGYCVYRNLDEDGKTFGSIKNAIEKGLALPYEEVFQKELDGTYGAVPVDSRISDKAVFMLGPQVDNPNSSEQVFQRIQELEQTGAVPKGLLGKFLFKIDNKNAIIPESFPIVS